MKKNNRNIFSRIVTYFILCFLILITCGLNGGKEIPSQLYCMDSNYVEFDRWRGYVYEVNINLKAEYETLFDFKQPQKEIKIYYDPNFKELAVSIKLTLRERKLHYQFFDKTGNLRREYFMKNDNFSGKYKTWYQNNILAEVSYYEKYGMRLYDSLFYENKNLWQVRLYNNNEPYKELYFHNDGRLSTENYNSIDPKTSLNHAIFHIEYDSLTGKPEMFFVDDIIIQEPDNPGVMISLPHNYIKVDSAKIIKR